MTRPSIGDCSGVHSHRLEGMTPVRTPGKIDKPLWAPTFGGPTETKKARSVVASSRVPRWAGCAGLPPAAGLFHRRLTGLLSRSPPTDTRPQARAYWALSYLFESRGNARGIFAAGKSFSSRRRTAALLPGVVRRRRDLTGRNTPVDTANGPDVGLVDNGGQSAPPRARQRRLC